MDLSWAAHETWASRLRRSRLRRRELSGRTVSVSHLPRAASHTGPVEKSFLGCLGIKTASITSATDATFRRHGSRFSTARRNAFPIEHIGMSAFDFAMDILVDKSLHVLTPESDATAKPDIRDLLLANPMSKRPGSQSKIRRGLVHGHQGHTFFRHS